MLKEFRVILDRPEQRTFFGGSEVSGILLVEVNRPMNIDSIKVKLIGQARTRLKKSTKRAGKNARKYTSDVELLVNSEIIVWTEQETFQDDPHWLQRGHYSFPFQFILPDLKPSTFQSDNGSIEYSVEGWIIPLGACAPLVTKVHIPVTETVTVNPPQLQTPVTQQVQQQIHHSGNVVLTVESPRTNYCAGEEIPFTVKVQNDTDYKVTLEAVLLRTMTYSAQGECHQSSHKIAKDHRKNAVQPRTTITWRPQGIQTTSSEHATSASSRIITVKHSIEVTAKVLSADKLLKTEVPLTIGNVPHQDTSKVMGHAPSPTLPLPNQLAQTTPHTSTHIHGCPLLTSQAPPTDTPPTYNAAIGTSTSTSSDVIRQGVSPSTESATSMKLASLPPPPYEVALTMPSLECIKTEANSEISD